MKPAPPAFARRHPQRWYEAWHTATRDALYVVLAYHQLAREQARGHVTSPLPMLFSDDEIVDANAQRKRTLRLYEVLLAKPGSHADDLVASADHAWLFIHRLYDRVPTTHRNAPPKTR